MASSLPSLKHDLTAVQSAVSSLLGKVQCAPTVPSWRFPEKTAAAVDLELVFRDIQLSQSGDKETGDARMLLTELLVDRCSVAPFVNRLCPDYDSSCVGYFSCCSCRCSYVRETASPPHLPFLPPHLPFLPPQFHLLSALQFENSASVL